MDQRSKPKYSRRIKPSCWNSVWHFIGKYRRDILAAIGILIAVFGVNIRSCIFKTPTTPQSERGFEFRQPPSSLPILVQAPYGQLEIFKCQNTRIRYGKEKTERRDKDWD